ncbi:DNA-binding NarL/FixJ family response regulator [Inhella inkyongensis]|uniref:DNA-binding NarL/FixJ family response regulator n=2 Tax=Inhella inkyongensis TaxID=392593 RepID=A0A840S1X3_9BURK|nr:response regulator transcription factor [Inhella inkyongensis]MBB5203086.1 DNA-binding NarL/FixJ family response regulator [Inhella inkyongensis]
MDELDGFSILLVDDHALFRDGIALALAQCAPGLRLIPVATLDEAQGWLQRAGADVDLVLIDYRLPGIDGLKGAVGLRAAFPQTACALMSGADDPALPERTRRAGLAGYFHKSIDLQRLLAGLRQLAAGETCFPSDSMAPDLAESAPLRELTERQREVLRRVAAGATNKEIALSMGIAPHTVKNHLAQAFERLGAANRTQAAAMVRDDQHG